jgi:hypothetical protein
MKIVYVGEKNSHLNYESVYNQILETLDIEECQLFLKLENGRLSSDEISKITNVFITQMECGSTCRYLFSLEEIKCKKRDLINIIPNYSTIKNAYDDMNDRQVYNDLSIIHLKWGSYYIVEVSIQA